jgi:two-component system CheB/CheR fusion protein
LDHELRVRKFTPKMAETFHLLPHDVGRRIDHFAHSIDSDSLLDDLDAVLRSVKPIERQVRDRNGNWFLMRILPYRSGSTVGGVVLTLIDIDRMKRAENASRIKDEQLAGILRNSPNWVFMKDVTGRYLLADEAFKNLVGCDPVGKSAFDLFPREVALQLVAQDAEVLRSEGTVETEVMIPHAEGPHTYLSVMFPIRDDQGQIIGLGGIRTDVTALKRAESEAREAVDQRDRFLAMLSHELRNPLAAIVNSIDVIGRVGHQSDEAARWFPVIERRARHMARLLDDLLDVARVTQGKIEIRQQPLDLATTLSSALEEIRGIFADRQLELIVEPPATPIPVNGDPARLQQVQVNLLMNAAKYTPAGGRVWYSVGTEGQSAVIRVRDTGTGMTPDVLRRAFEPFVQADETLDRADGGIGVGLTLVRAIVERHSGTIEAHSGGLGKGSEFIVRLPLSAPVEAAPPADSTNNHSVGPLRVLIVEDDPDIRDLLQTMLQMDGHNISAVGNGTEALAAIEGTTPDVALVDIGLPGMNGYELARAIRGNGFHRIPRLIALTGYGQASDRKEAVAAGFDHHLTKPPDPKALDALLRAAAEENGRGSSVKKTSRPATNAN